MTYTPDIPEQAIQNVNRLAKAAKAYGQSPMQRAQSIVDHFQPNWQNRDLDWAALRSAIAQQIVSANDELLRSVEQQQSGLGPK